MTTEDKSQIPSFSLEDEKEAFELPNRLQKNGTPKSTQMWTGFQGKTLWDWLQLVAALAIPLILGIATLLFGIQQAHLADLQHQSDQKLAQQQHVSDQESALDQQRQATLVTYQDNMKDLLLNRGLLTSKPDNEVRVLARTATLTAMRQLDGERNTILLQFLQDAQLIGQGHDMVSFTNVNLRNSDLSGTSFANIDLSGADLSGARLYGANLSRTFFNNANLNDTNLSYAFLSGADLSSATLGDAILNNARLYGANLSGANLSGADLSGAILTGAKLNGVDLTGAKLFNTDFSGADLNGADLSGTNLLKTNLLQQQLVQVKSCKGAILPKRLTCHNNQ